MQTESMLTLVELATTYGRIISVDSDNGASRLTVVVDTEQRANAVDDEKAELACSEVLRQLRKEVALMLAVGRSGDGDVVIGHVRIDTKPLGDVCNPLGAECAFGIYIETDVSRSVAPMASSRGARGIPM